MAASTELEQHNTTSSASSVNNRAMTFSSLLQAALTEL
jgi:hypothetical protein